MSTKRFALPALAGAIFALGFVEANDTDPRTIKIRGIYGGVPTEILDQGQTLDDYGINAVWIGSGGLTTERVELLRDQGAKVFAEFNTLHVANYLKENPDAAPIGPDGEVSPPPAGWQGICPTHEAYRQFRMDDFRRVLSEFDIDGIWLDYHHAHASWERDEPLLPDTCFCPRCLAKFQHDTGIELPDRPTSELSEQLLGPLREQWVDWRCEVFTDWVREFRELRDEVRPDALLGTFHCPWSDTDYDGALRDKLAIDLKAQAEYIDIFSIMPYHARFGHADDPEWIARQSKWLGEYLGIEGLPTDRNQIWPIVQISDWGETVPPEQVRTVIEQGTVEPVTGVMAFAWSGIAKDPEKIEQIGAAYRALKP